MDRLQKITSGDLLSSGIYPGLSGEAAPLWQDGSNVLFVDGGVRKSQGLTGLETLGARPTGLKSVVADTEPRLFIGAGDAAYRYRSSDGATVIAGFASSGGIYQFVPWDTWALISNGVDPVQLWQNAGLAADITAPFTRANVIFKYQQQAFAGGTDNGGNYVEWSPINSVTDWTETIVNTAGNLSLRDLEGDIVAAQPIGNSIGIYGQANAGIFTVVGGTVSYGFRSPIRGVSAISPYSVVSVGDRHYGVTKDNIFLTDLVSLLLIDEPAVRTYIQANADWDRATEVYGWPDWANSMVRWSIPKLGGGSFGIGLRYEKNTWTRFDDSVVAGDTSGPFPNMFLATTSRLLRADKMSYNNDGGAFASMVWTKPMDLGDRNRMKRISMISLDAVWTGAVLLEVGYSNHPNGTVDWVISTPFANVIFPDQFGVQSETAFLSLRISSVALGANWKISGGEVFGKVGGFVVGGP